jgi:hypothetical protein
MSNVFATLPAPPPNGTGAPLNVTDMAAEKTFTTEGGFTGRLVIEASADGGSTFAPLFFIDGPDGSGQVVSCACTHLRLVWQNADQGNPGSAVVDLAADVAAVSNTLLPLPTGPGPGTAIDTSAFDGSKAIIVTGSFAPAPSGTAIVISGSADGASFDPLFVQVIEGAACVPFDATYQFMRVESVSIVSGSILSVSLACAITSGSTPFAYWDFNPAPVDNTLIGPGVSPLVSRGDHIHGLTFNDAVLPSPVGTPASGTNPYPARLDHVHEGVATLNGEMGAIALESLGGTVVITKPTGSTINFEILPTGATWPLAGMGIFAVSANIGNDANAGFVISPTQLAIDVRAATQAAGAVAKATLAGLAAILPPVGNNRAILIVIDAATYADSLSLLDCLHGYAVKIIRGTGTVASGSAVAFFGDQNDITCLGNKTAAGMNAAGYNPTGPGTSNQIALAKVGGGGPAFPAEPGRPLYCRLRGDIGNPTVATRNAVYSIIARTAVNTVQIDQTITFAAGDVFYIEDPGVVGTGDALFTGGNLLDVHAGLSCTGTMSLNSGIYSVSNCQATSGWFTNYTRQTATPQAQWSMIGRVLSAVGLPITTVGPCRTDGNAEWSGGSLVVPANSLCIVGNLQVTSFANFAFLDNNVVGGFAEFFGNIGTGFYAPNSCNYGGNAGAGASPVRTFGTIYPVGATIEFGDLATVGTNIHAMESYGEINVVMKGTFTGPSQTDAGCDFTNVTGGSFFFPSPTLTTNSPTVTGSKGDFSFGSSTYMYGSPSSQSIYGTWIGFGDTASHYILPKGLRISTGMPGDLSVPASIFQGNAVLCQATGNFVGGVAIPQQSVVAFVATDSFGVQLAEADTQADAIGGLGVAICAIPSGQGGMIAVSGCITVMAEPGQPVQLGGLPAYLSASTAGTATSVSPSAGGTRQKRRLGWWVDERVIRWSPDNIPVAADGAL